MIYAPVYIPTLCRFDHFKKCIESLANCAGANETEVYVALDYPAKESHKEGYEKIKSYLESVGNMNFKKLHIHKRDRNYGLGPNGNSATMGEYIRERYDRYIVSEDDNIFSPNFLLYMNTCLEHYKDDPDVVAVCGYSYPVNWVVSEGATVFKQQMNVAMWGTGFWTKKYEVIKEDLSGGLLRHSFASVLKNKAYKKMIDACFIEYIYNACNFKNSANLLFLRVSDIAMREYLAVKNKYAVTPVISKTRNLGFDGSGAYCQNIDAQKNGNTAGSYNYSSQPIDTSNVFTLKESTIDSAEDNRLRLNKFDYRSPEKLALPNRLLWIADNFGIPVAKLFFIGSKIWAKLF